MGDFEKHLKLAKEKLEATLKAYHEKQNTVVGDLGTKVVEQLVERYKGGVTNQPELF